MTDAQLLDTLPDGALRKYVEYWKPTTDAPLVYLIAGALVAVATVCKNNVFLPFGGQLLFPHLWVLLLGPSSRYRKSTAINQARQVIEVVHPGVVLPDEFSREALVRHLSAQPSGLLTSREFGGFLANAGKDYMQGTKEMLADMYDAPEHYSRKVGEKTYAIVRPCFSIFAASEMKWFTEKINETDMRSGFLARFLYVPAYSKPELLPFPIQPNSAVGAELQSLLQAISEMQGGFEFEERAKHEFSEWAIRLDGELAASAEEARLSPFYTRLAPMALKLAMILQVSGEGGLVIGTDTMKRALALAEHFKGILKELFDKDLVFGRAMQERQKVLRLIEKHGDDGISRRELMRASNLLKKELDPIVDTLKEENSIQPFIGKDNQPRYRRLSQLLSAA